MKFNFFVVPAVIILTAYIGGRFTRKGIRDWYSHLKKPSWTPSGKTIGQIWTLLYLLTGFGILWFWNVPVYGITHYVIGIILIVNAYLNAFWNKVFFVEHNFAKAYKWMIFLNATTILVILLMLPKSFIAPVLFIPYVVWVGIATKLTKQIWHLNK